MEEGKMVFQVEGGTERAWHGRSTRHRWGHGPGHQGGKAFGVYPLEEGIMLGVLSRKELL